MKTRIKKSLLLLLIGLGVNVALALVKLYVGLKTNSLTIMLDATNSFFDILTCIATAAAFLMLLRARNEAAPYGYGRVEYLAGFVVAVVTVVVGGMFFVRSLNRLAMPKPVYFGWQSCVLISIGVPIKLGVGFLYRFQNKKLKSKALKSIMLDSFLDAFITATSLVSFAITTQIDYAADAIFGIVMSVIVIVLALRLVVDNIKAIVKGDSDAEELKAHLSASDKIVALRKVVVHDYGYAAKVATVEAEFAEGVGQEDIRALADETRGKFPEMEEVDFVLACSEDKAPEA